MYKDDWVHMITGEKLVSHRKIHDDLRRAVRLAKGGDWDQQDIAKAIGTTPETFSTWLNGGSLGPQLTEKLQEWLDSNGLLREPSPTTDPLDATAVWLEGAARSIRSTTGFPLEARYGILLDALETFHSRFEPVVIRGIETEKQESTPNKE